MLWVRFEPTIPGSDRAKTVHALDRSATVTGIDHLQDVTTNNYYTIADLQASNDSTLSLLSLILLVVAW
jgi:hypothetical protein